MSSSDEKPSLRAIIEAALKASPRLSVRNLARRAEMSPSELSRILAGTRNPGPAALRRLARALALEPAYLLHVAGILEDEEWRRIARPEARAGRGKLTAREAGSQAGRAPQESYQARETPASGEPMGLTHEEWEVVFLLRSIESRQLREAVLTILRQLPRQGR